MVWGAIAYVIGASHVHRPIWGGVIASPAIGVVVGLCFGRLWDGSFGRRVLVALLSLYLAASLFGVGVGVYDAMRDVPGRAGLEVVIEWVLAILWGLTVGGWFVVLWPLTYATHRVLSRIADVA